MLAELRYDDSAKSLNNGRRWYPTDNWHYCTHLKTHNAIQRSPLLRPFLHTCCWCPRASFPFPQSKFSKDDTPRRGERAVGTTFGIRARSAPLHVKVSTRHSKSKRRLHRFIRQVLDIPGELEIEGVLSFLSLPSIPPARQRSCYKWYPFTIPKCWTALNRRSMVMPTSSSFCGVTSKSPIVRAVVSGFTTTSVVICTACFT